MFPFMKKVFPFFNGYFLFGKANLLKGFGRAICKNGELSDNTFRAIISNHNHKGKQITYSFYIDLLKLFFFLIKVKGSKLCYIHD